MKLCRDCEPLLFRVDLDTLDKLRVELCPVCLARVNFRLAPSLRMGISKRKAKLLRKYGEVKR